MKTATKTSRKTAGRGAAKKTAAKKTTASKQAQPAKKAAVKQTAAKKAAPKKTASRAQQVDDQSLLEEFFVDELKDIYWAEKHLVKALGKLSKAATSSELQEAFLEHQEQTEEHVNRLEEVFEMMGKKAQAKKCDAMAGITEEANGVIEETPKGTFTRDVALIFAGQKAEHYEIATYGGLVQIARTIGRDDVAEILEMTLNEEKETDELLTQLAENNINIQASQEDEDDEEEGEDEESDEDEDEEYDDEEDESDEEDEDEEA